MRSYGFKKGLLLTLGISFLSTAIARAREQDYYLSAMLGIVGFGLICIFVYFVEKQAIHETILQLSAKKRKRK